VLIIFLCIGCDQISKAAAYKYLVHARPASCCCDFLRLQYAENKGALLGFGASFPETIRFGLLVVATGFILLGLTGFLLFKRTLSQASLIALSFILGGGLGNLIDRILITVRLSTF